jgi:Protein of unknown function (DUF3631)
MNPAYIIETEPDLERVFKPQRSTDPLGDVERFIRRFAVLPEGAYLSFSAWIVATYFCDCFDCFPYVALLSPVKRCGKTRVLEVFELLSHEPWRGTAPSPAALYRMMQSAPTLLLDEVEALEKRSASDTQQAILSILNAGHRRGASIPRCDGRSHELRHFPVYGPKAFAAIGSLPETLLDRSIVVTMQRRLPGQKVERLLWRKGKKEAEPLAQALRAFAEDSSDAIERAYEKLMGTDLPWLSDRDADLWMPLYAVCSIGAPSRLGELEEASISLCGSKAETDEEESLALKLLKDLIVIWPGDELRVETKVLISRLKEQDLSPWGEKTSIFLDASSRGCFGCLRSHLSNTTAGSGAISGLTWTARVSAI